MLISLLDLVFIVIIPSTVVFYILPKQTNPQKKNTVNNWFFIATAVAAILIASVASVASVALTVAAAVAVAAVVL